MSSETVLSVQIAQDPANTTPEKTGRLCFVCNSQYSTDLTAQHALDLWNAGVSRNSPGDPGPHLKDHYWTNAVMHGVGGTFRDKTFDRARKHCASVLHMQLRILSPKVIIACGTVAARSLYDLDVLEVPWGRVRQNLSEGAYCTPAKLPSGAEGRVLCTYHTSARGVVAGPAKLHSSKTDRSVYERLDRLGWSASAEMFLSKYSGCSAKDKGMRVLLLHWLDIGDAIGAHGIVDPTST